MRRIGGLLLALCLLLGGCKAEAKPMQPTEEAPLTVLEADETVELQAANGLERFQLILTAPQEEGLLENWQVCGTQILDEDGQVRLELCQVALINEHWETEPESLSASLQGQSLKIGPWSGEVFYPEEEGSIQFFLDDGRFKIHAKGASTLGLPLQEEHEALLKCLEALELSLDRRYILGDGEGIIQTSFTAQELAAYSDTLFLNPFTYMEWDDAEDIESLRFSGIFALNPSGKAEYDPELFYVGRDDRRDEIPQDIYEASIQEIFDVSSEHLRNNDFYCAEEQLYTGYLGGPLRLGQYLIYGTVTNGAQEEILFDFYDEGNPRGSVSKLIRVGIVRREGGFRFSYVHHSEW